MVKKKEVKSLNISLDVHTALKMQAMLTGKNMTEIAESAILNSISEEVKALLNSNSNILGAMKNNSSKKEETKEDTVQKKVVANGPSKGEEAITTDNDEIDPEIGCYM